MAQKPESTVLSHREELAAFLPLHYQQSAVFLEEMSASINNWDDAWSEMIYCVLAGTQVSTNIVKKSYLHLMDSIPEITNYNYIAAYSSKYQKEIASVLRENGYRFYSTKSGTIVNSAKFYHTIVDKYRELNKIDPLDARRTLIKNVNGVGNKIASHWIRNIGYQIPIIDIHVRRVLCCAGFIERKYLKSQISDSEYHHLENVVIDLAKQINLDVGRLDYILWIHGREYCVGKNCSTCPFGGIHV